MKYRNIIRAAIVILIIAAGGIVYAQEGGKTYTVGDLILVGDVGFKAEMTQMGYVEGQNITYLYIKYDQNIPWGTKEWQEDYERQIKAMVDTGVDIFVTNTDTDAVNLQSLVGNSPIIFARSDDPVATGAVKDLVTPGGSITGIITNKHHERRLQILTEIKPSTKKIYYIYSTNTGEAETVLQQVRNLAAELGVEVVAAPMIMFDAASAQEVIKNIPDDVDWIFLTPYALFDAPTTEQLIAASVSRKAGITWVADLLTKGYLMSYGPSMNATGKQAAQIVDRIIRGASPADLPVQTAENYLWMNLEAADAIGLDIPVSVLRQTNTIIRAGYFDNLDAFGNPINSGN